MRDSVVIKIESDPKYLSVVRAATVKIGEVYGLSESALEDIKLGVDEACSNVIRHAYGGDIHQSILIKYKMTPKGFEVLIEDHGMKVPPESIEGRNLEDIRPGGLGVHLIKRAFDIVQFDQKKRKGNRLRLVRFKK